MRKGKILGIMLTASLVVGVSSFATTLAYNTDRESVTNVLTFTGRDGLNAVLTEPHWDPKSGIQLLPDMVISKDPIVTNTSESDIDELVALKVEFLYTSSCPDKSKVGKVLSAEDMKSVADVYTINYNADSQVPDWFRFGSETKLNPVQRFYYGNVLKRNKQTSGVGETRKIIDYVVNTPGNGGDQNYIFKSSDTSILRVDQSGNLTGCGTGFATVSITSKYPDEKGNYVSASTTYHVCEYDDATIMKYLVRDKKAEKEFMDRINQERVSKGYQSFQYTAYGAECSMVRALYNIFNNIKNPLTTPTDIIGHGGSQNSHGGYATYKYTGHREGYGTEIANGLLSSPPHYINNTSTTKDTKYAWCVVLRYYDPAGVGFSVMIETFNGLYSDEEQDSMWSESVLLKENSITCSLEPEVYARYKSIYDTYGSLMTVY